MILIFMMIFFVMERFFRVNVKLTIVRCKFSSIISLNVLEAFRFMLNLTLSCKVLLIQLVNWVSIEKIMILIWFFIKVGRILRHSIIENIWIIYFWKVVVILDLIEQIILIGFLNFYVLMIILQSIKALEGDRIIRCRIDMLQMMGLVIDMILVVIEGGEYFGAVAMELLFG